MHRPTWAESGFKGVRVTKDKKWQAKIQVNKKNIYLGRFRTAEEAARAYDAAARQHFADFAVLNFP